MAVFLFWAFITTLSKSIGIPDYSARARALPNGQGLGPGLGRCSEVTITMGAYGLWVKQIE